LSYFLVHSNDDDDGDDDNVLNDTRWDLEFSILKMVLSKSRSLYRSWASETWLISMCVVGG